MFSKKLRSFLYVNELKLVLQVAVLMHLLNPKNKERIVIVMMCIKLIT